MTIVGWEYMLKYYNPPVAGISFSSQDA